MSGDTETVYLLKIKSTFTGFESYDNFDFLALRYQTVTFEKPFFSVSYTGFI